MRELLIVETRDAADHKDPERMLEIATGICRGGVPAAVFLTENAAFNARRESQYRLGDAFASGVRIAVDRFALEERGIRSDQLQDGVLIADVDLVVDHLRDGSAVMWR